MSSEKTLAIVLKVIEYSETSCIITLFTESSGKISGLAKGARRPKGPFHGAIDVLSISQIMFLPRKSANLDLLTEAKLERRFRPCQWSLARLYAGYYVAELLVETMEPHSAMPELFQQTIRSLNDLQRLETDWQFLPASSILMRFELQLMSLLGNQIGLDNCGLCGCSMGQFIADPKTKSVPFSLLESSFLCPLCVSGRRQLVPVNVNNVQSLQALQSHDDLAWRKLAQQMVNLQLRDLLDQYWRVLLNKRLKLQPAIRQIVAKERKKSAVS